MSKERQFKGLSLSERKEARRENSLKPVLQLMEPLAFSVTVKDVCQEAKLTERYFYESFKRVKIYSRLSFKMIEELQQNLMQAVIKAAPDPEQMVDAGLRALLSTLKDDPRLARIVYVDAILVQELHNQATIQETLAQFDRMIQAFVMLTMPQIQHNENELSLIATGLNGYVTQIAVRWVMGGFKQSLEQVLAACRIVLALLAKVSK